MQEYHEQPEQESFAFGDEIIIAAAVKYENLVVFCERPGRHHHALHAMHDIAGARGKGQPAGTQGFVTNRGRFVDRREGCSIARAAGQIITKHGPENTLFSEDMW